VRLRVPLNPRPPSPHRVRLVRGFCLVATGWPMGCFPHLLRRKSGVELIQATGCNGLLVPLNPPFPPSGGFLLPRCEGEQPGTAPIVQPNKNTTKEVGEDARDLPHPGPLPKEREHRR
jgi:hypothetical protein